MPSLALSNHFNDMTNIYSLIIERCFITDCKRDWDLFDANRQYMFIKHSKEKAIDPIIITPKRKHIVSNLHKI